MTSILGMLGTSLLLLCISLFSFCSGSALPWITQTVTWPAYSLLFVLSWGGDVRVLQAKVTAPVCTCHVFYCCTLQVEWHFSWGDPKVVDVPLASMQGQISFSAWDCASLLPLLALWIHNCCLTCLTGQNCWNWANGRWFRRSGHHQWPKPSSRTRREELDKW